ncbi:MAG: GNAT family N-acetyltransferase [Gemmatimonas sp.]
MTIVRTATPEDAGELARLLTGLGHPTSASFIIESWSAWSDEHNVAMVASADGASLIGLVTVHHMRVLHRPLPVGRITALFVDEPFRGQGIGRTLVDAAERELAARGCGLLEITSNVRRADAHAFYESLGYERTSVRLVKSIATAAR